LARYFANSICPGVEGVILVSSSDVVQKLTYFKNRSVIFIS